MSKKSNVKRGTDSQQRRVIPLEVLEKYRAELFEDGVQADLHDAGIKTLAEAYRQGREDMLEEIKGMASQAV